SLMGDAMAHAILPGVAVGFLTAGLSITAMAVGGMVTGLIVALLAAAVARLTPQREDASFAAFYLVSLGMGVLLISLRGSNMDLIHVLFGTVLGLDDAALLLVSATSSITLLVLAVVFRALVLECMDTLFLRSESRRGPLVQGGMGRVLTVNLLLCLVLIVCSRFRVFAVWVVLGLFMLPRSAAGLWPPYVVAKMAQAGAVHVVPSYAGMLLLYYVNVPASP